MRFRGLVHRHRLNDEIGDSVKAFNKLVAALAEARQSERAVRDFSQMLASWLELETLAERALQQIMTQTQSSAGALLVETEGELRMAATHGLRGSTDLRQNDHVRAALRTGQRQRVLLPPELTVEGGAGRIQTPRGVG